VRPDFPLPDVTWAPVAPFWAAAAEGRLSLPRCVSCARLCWYPKDECPVCGGRSFRWDTVAGRGRLFSWSVVRHPFLPQFREKVPYATGLVALDEDPAVRLVTGIVDVSPSELRIDMPMEVVFRPLQFAGVEGSVVAPMWRPA
jgi:uncharacterized OB-fold protein